jgi:predicted transposase/invertase (TIGR01784 family)
LENYRTNLETDRELTPEDEDLIMNLSTAYLKKREEWKLEGKLEGVLEGKLEEKTEVAINLLREGLSLDLIARTVGISIDTLESLRDRL